MQAPLEVLWVGNVGGMEADLVARAGLDFRAIQGSAVVGVGPVRAALGLTRLAWGTLQIWRIMRDFRPDVVFATGGYSAISAAPVCWLRHVPLVVYLPDIEPGSAIRVISRFARQMLVTAEESRQYFPNNDVRVTGYPVRAELTTATREAAHQHFGLAPDRQTVLFMGGSRGARSINMAVLAHLGELLGEVQIIHITGQLDWPTVSARREQLPPELREHYHTYPYLHDEMGLAYAAPDLVVARSGASTLGEFPMFGLAAILVPYPYAWRYQKVNADTLVDRGAAIRLDDEKLNTELVATIRGLLSQPERLAAMRTAAQSAAVPQAADNIAQALQTIAGERSS